MRHKQAASSLMLLLTAFLWGMAFTAQNIGMDHIGPLTFNGIRYLIGTAVLLPVIAFRRKQRPRPQEGSPRGIAASGGSSRPESMACAPGQPEDSLLTLLTGGLLCGLALGLASALQQYGILLYKEMDASTNVGKTGFLTALYIIIVPLLGIPLGRRATLPLWISVLLGLGGLYLLSAPEGVTSVSPADLVLLACAFVYSVQILLVDHFSPLTDSVQLACLQFLTSGIVCGLPALFLEHQSFSDILAAGIPLLYAGVLSCGVAYTLQIVAQKNLHPAVASLLMSLESVFSLFGGWLILHQTLSRREGLGCAVVFAAIILAQIPLPGKQEKELVMN